ncbi:hypothetical protein [Spirosoma oryzicola]|uniref:hypothetical protein n=1 Tax=Spirosoma oryzicola TaxID=2898794 RepID=UPI001E57B951|nr:hypothetical protein [Spirosoma oryzicola]UHG94325.1 hypothetical protein LQ777_26690 [Spirosoma oryzicola]
MKTYLVITALSILTILSASAQDDSKLRRDVTYSTHNYKHPNKAATARQWAAKKGIAVNAPTLSQGPAVSYKHQAPGAKPVGGMVVPHTPESDVALRNYKIQRGRESRPAATDSEVTAGVQQKQPSTSGN